MLHYWFSLTNICISTIFYKSNSNIKKIDQHEYHSYTLFHETEGVLNVVGVLDFIFNQTLSNFNINLIKIRTMFDLG